MIYLLSFLAFWLACGFVAAGWEYAYLQCEYPELAERDRGFDRLFAWGALLMGAIAIIVSFENGSRRHGWRKWW